MSTEFMLSQSKGSFEHLSASFTREVPCIGMYRQMFIQSTLCRESFAAVFTVITVLPLVHQHVSLEVSLVGRFLLADGTVPSLEKQ